MPKSGTEREIPADLILIAMGFTPDRSRRVHRRHASAVTERGAFGRDSSYESTVPGVFVAGDAGRGQSLIVWAIAEGRAAAANVDRFLMGSTVLPEPVRPSDVAIGLQPA